MVEVDDGGGLSPDEIVDPDEVAQLEAGLVLGIRDYFGKLRLPPGAVVGLSGGIDSAVTAHLATLALGLFWTTAWLGRRLRRNLKNNDLRQIHSYCGFLAVFIALFVAVLGMRLLP